MKFINFFVRKESAIFDQWTINGTPENYFQNLTYSERQVIKI